MGCDGVVGVFGPVGRVGRVVTGCGFLFLLGLWPPLKVGVLIREAV